ncbi:hypothetical protein [Actinacidiphila oryziradicis]|uniref:Uncharacterized protein n=1 Tax=Actinacidiphila oryziradicis TaxID=2571141 RepID=A0A4U0SIN9_9ACTN|nr:hypothetical protein [Actinacidiphila oryziradicis]TKA09452.1 hypothetical protein FCI23_23000 [Actinacidiphila oryziradicis]
MFVSLLGVGAVTSIGLGAILAFAVDWQWEGANRQLIGLIMMAVGFLALAAFVGVYRDHDVHSGHDSHS